MRFDNGKEIKEFTTMDNEILDEIAKIEDLSKLTKAVLLSLCRQIFWQDDNHIVSTSGWGAADITAKDIGCSERGVRRAYKELAKRNIISKRLAIREENIDGKGIPRKVNWITINTNPSTWAIKRWVTKPCPVTKIAVP
jgi:hypothetical protein